MPDVPRALAASPHSPPALLSGDGALRRLVRKCAGSADVRACVCGRRESVVDVRVCAYARGEHLMGVINIITLRWCLGCGQDVAGEVFPCL